MTTNGKLPLSSTKYFSLVLFLSWTPQFALQQSCNETCSNNKKYLMKDLGLPDKTCKIKVLQSSKSVDRLSC